MEEEEKRKRERGGIEVKRRWGKGIGKEREKTKGETSRVPTRLGYHGTYIARKGKLASGYPEETRWDEENRSLKTFRCELNSLWKEAEEGTLDR